MKTEIDVTKQPKLKKRKKSKIYLSVFAIVLAFGFLFSNNGIYWVSYFYRKNKINNTWITWRDQASGATISDITNSANFTGSPLKVNNFLNPVLINQKIIKYHTNKRSFFNPMGFDKNPSNSPGSAIKNVFSYQTGMIYQLHNIGVIDAKGYTRDYQLNNWTYDDRNNDVVINDHQVIENQYSVFAQAAVAQNLLGIIKVVKPEWIKAGVKATDLKITKNFKSVLDFNNKVNNSGKITITISDKLLGTAACQIASPILLNNGTSSLKYDVNYWTTN